MPSSIPIDDLSGLHHLLVESVHHDAIVTLDRDGHVLSWNAAAERVLGFARADIVGEHCGVLYTAEHAASGLPEYEQGLALEHGYFEDDVWRRRRDGSRFRAHVILTALRDDDKEVIAFGCFIRDIDTRSDPEPPFEVVVRASPIGIFHADTSGHIRYANPRSLEILGMTEEEALGRGWVSRVHPEDIDVLMVGWQSANDAAREYRHDVRLLMPDSSTRWLRCRTAPLLDSESVLIGTVGTVEDITAQRTLENQFVQAQKMEAVGRLAGGIAHDFNNVLVSIICSAEFLQADLPPGDARRADVDEIISGARRAATLTRQLLAFGRKQMLAPSALELNTIVTETAGLLTPILGESLHLATLLAPVPVLVYADRAQIEQVLMNLAVNARDAMPHGGTLTIEVDFITNDPSGRQWGTLTVGDTGVGMPSHVQAQAFEPFYTTKPLGQGSGLGLSTVEGIVRQSGGTISLHSQPGLGTTFSIRLPLAEEIRITPVKGMTIVDTDARGRPSGSVSWIPDVDLAEPTTVLVVEDEEAVRSIARRVLEREGFRVLTARHGGDAMRVLGVHRNSVTVLLSDVVMPQMGGLELAARAAKRVPGLRILLMSGYAELDLGSVEHQRIIDGFLYKPFSAESLLAAVRAVSLQPVRSGR